MAFLEPGFEPHTLKSAETGDRAAHAEFGAAGVLSLLSRGGAASRLAASDKDTKLALQLFLAADAAALDEPTALQALRAITI